MADKDLRDRVEYWDKQHRSIAPPLGPAHLGILLAAGLPRTFYFLADDYLDTHPIKTNDDRLILLARLQIIPALVFVFNVGVSGASRVLSSPAAAHDPVAAAMVKSKSVAWQTGVRIVSNTLEQYVILFSTSCCLATVLRLDEMAALPALYLTWGVGRILFALGYMYNGSARMIGFPATFMPTAAALMFSCYRLFQEMEQ